MSDTGMLEEDVVKRLTGRFGYVTAAVQRARRVWAETPKEHFIEVLTFIKDELNFGSLCTVTGLDMGDSFQLIYHLAEKGGIVLSLKENTPKSDPVFETATDLYKGGVLYELEARNLLGLTIHGIPGDIRYPLPDNWPEGQYPLRKDWKGLDNKELKKNGESSNTAGPAAPGA